MGSDRMKMFATRDNDKLSYSSRCFIDLISGLAEQLRRATDSNSVENKAIPSQLDFRSVGEP